MPILRPITDVATTGWTVVGAASAAAALNEVVASAAEYAVSDDVTTNPPGLVVGLGGTIPLGPTDINVQLWGLGASARLVFLDNSNAEQGATEWQILTDTPTDYTLSATLTGAATRVRVEVEAIVGGCVFVPGVFAPGVFDSSGCPASGSALALDAGAALFDGAALEVS
jgi:hypothetical protein